MTATLRPSAYTNTPEPAADLKAGMQILLNAYGSNNQPKIVTKALARPLTVVSLELKLAQELADRVALDKQIRELTMKDKCITAQADALNVERHHFALPVKARTGVAHGYGVDSFNFSTIGENSAAGQSALSPALTSLSPPLAQPKVCGKMHVDSL